MKRATGFAICLLSVSVAAPALADSKIRFGASGFLDSFDAFIEQQQLKADAAVDGLVLPGSVEIEVDLSVRGDQEEPEPGFLYLREKDEPGSRSKGRSYAVPSKSFTSRSELMGESAIFNAPGVGGQSFVSGFTPRYANAHIGFSYIPDNSENPDRGSLDIALSSQIAVESIDLMSAVNSAYSGSGYDRRSYNLGLDIGYWGFNLGASVFRRESGFESTYQGFDFGLSYRYEGFSTSLSVGEVNRRDQGLLVEPIVAGLDRNFYRFELGAAYDLNRAFRFSGGVRMFQYGPEFGFDADGMERSQVFYLGTRLSF